ncbi:MAG: cupin domain-containing protein [Tissierellia bacterium]|jgi:transcriptional regulator with XRE-family HTH domain|nr:cupin domain-containing protein [Tissierellia bacterium]
MDNNVGAKLKNLRTINKLTLKELSKKTGLSVGLLSQVERGISSIAIDSLAKVVSVYNMDLSEFFEKNEPKLDSDPVIRSFDLSANQISPYIIQFVLSDKVKEFDMLPRLFQLQPLTSLNRTDVELYNHFGEEFVYVLEGVVTVIVDKNRYILYPGDSIQIHSDVDHNWVNNTNKVAKILTVNLPNPFKDGEKITIITS